MQAVSVAWQLALGRGPLPGDNQPGHDRVAVLDYGFWRIEPANALREG